MKNNNLNLKKEVVKKFRLNAKKLYLTYSSLGVEAINLEAVLNALSFIVQIDEYLLALELHKDSSYHVHVLLILNKKCNFSSANCLDIEIENKIRHGNYQSGKNIKALINYLVKNENYITNMKFDLINNKVVEPEEYVFIKGKELGINRALKNYKDKYPERAHKKLSSLKTNLDLAEKIENNLNVDLNNIELKDFNLDKIERNSEFKQWLKDEIRKTLILVGASGHGKSLLAKSIMKDLNIKYLRATHYQGLKNLNKEHQGFILDDAKLSFLSEAEIINLFDTNESADLRVLYGMTKKEKHLVQILTINSLKDIIKNLTPQLNRRCLLLNIDKPIINVTINNNFYLNNKENDNNNLEVWNKLKEK
jgi:hypothetical protein